MDAHYEQVMAERERLGDGPPRAYFAYSTVLDPAAFEEWRHQHGYDFFQLPQGTRAEAFRVGSTGASKACGAYIRECLQRRCGGGPSLLFFG